MTSDASWTGRRPRVDVVGDSQFGCCWVLLRRRRVVSSRVELVPGPGRFDATSARSVTGRWWLRPRSMN